MNKIRLNFFSWGLFFVYFSILFFFFFGGKGLISYYKLEQRIQKLQHKIKEKENSEEILLQKQKALLSNGDYYQTVIKDKLLYIKENETILFFPQKK